MFSCNPGQWNWEGVLGVPTSLGFVDMAVLARHMAGVMALACGSGEGKGIGKSRGVMYMVPAPAAQLEPRVEQEPDRGLFH